jgi:DnaJ-domain-containing protein 1
MCARSRVLCGTVLASRSSSNVKSSSGVRVIRKGAGIIDFLGNLFILLLICPTYLLEWWEVLGVSFDADQKTVKAAYYPLAKKNHPDQNMDQNKQNAYAVAMQKINHAYDKFCSQQETL